MPSTNAHVARFTWLMIVLFILSVFLFQVFLVLAPVVDYDSGDIISMKAATKIVDLYQAEFSEWREEEGSLSSVFSSCIRQKSVSGRMTACWSSIPSACYSHQRGESAALLYLGPRDTVMPHGHALVAGL